MRLNTADMPHLVKELDEKFKSYSGPLDYVIDVGAHVGLFSCLAAERGAKLVLALEPSPANFQILLENITQNKFQNVIVPLPYAVTTENWQIRILRSAPGNSGQHSLAFREEYQGTRVWTISLWTLIESLPRVDFLKIDIEGEEWNLLTDKKAVETLKQVYHVDIEQHVGCPYGQKFSSESYEKVETMLQSIYDLQNVAIWKGNLKSQFARLTWETP